MNSFFVMAALGVLFGWAIWRAGTWRGARGIIIGWVLSVVGVTALMTFQIHRTQAALGFTPEQQQRFPVFWTFLPMWGVAFGAVALVIRRAILRGEVRFTAGLAARSFGAWLMGALAFFLVFAALDIVSLLRLGT
jgi:hypothetical protein